MINVLQWLNPEAARFTIEGEGIEVWCCPQSVVEEQTEPPQSALTTVNPMKPDTASSLVVSGIYRYAT